MLFVLALVAVEPDVLPLVAPDVLPEVAGDVGVVVEPALLPVPLVPDPLGVPEPEAPIAPVPEVEPLAVGVLVDVEGEVVDAEGEVVVEGAAVDGVVLPVAFTLLSVDRLPLAPAAAPDCVPKVELPEAVCA